MQKCIAAFEDGGEEDKSLPDNSPAVREAVDAQAQLWIDKGSNFAQAGDSAAALRCWDQAVLVSTAKLDHSIPCTCDRLSRLQ